MQYLDLRYVIELAELFYQLFHHALVAVCDYRHTGNAEVFGFRNVKTYYITEKVMKKVSSMVSIPYVVGLAYKFNPADYKNRLLLLDNIQDPGNLGTIIRSAKAFNIDTIILNTNSVDLYNEKVIRSSEGIMFHICLLYTSDAADE